MTQVNEKNFNAYLKTTEGNAGTVADRITSMLDFARSHYGIAPDKVEGEKAKKASGDSRYFAMVMNGNYRSVRKEAIRAYICATTNLKCQQNEDKSFKFVKNDKSAVKGLLADLPVDAAGTVIQWDAFTAEKVNTAFEIDKRIKALISQCKAALEGKDGKKISGTKAHTEKQLHALEGLLKA